MTVADPIRLPALALLLAALLASHASADEVKIASAPGAGAGLAGD